MKALTVRITDSTLISKLLQRAANLGITAEEAHLRVLQEVLELAEPEDFPDLKGILAQMPNVGEDSDFERPRERPGKLLFQD